MHSPVVSASTQLYSFTGIPITHSSVPALNDETAIPSPQYYYYSVLTMHTLILIVINIGNVSSGLRLGHSQDAYSSVHIALQ